MQQLPTGFTEPGPEYEKTRINVNPSFGLCKI